MFTKSQSKTKPLTVENVGNGRYIIRQHIEETDDGNGGTIYTYDENIVTKSALDVMQCVEGVELKREAVIIDEYTQQLMEEGTL
jgi:hypothetical protein